MAGEETYGTAGTITLAGNLTVPDGASLILRAGQSIIINPTFRVNAGGTLSARIVASP